MTLKVATLAISMVLAAALAAEAAPKSASQLAQRDILRGAKQTALALKVKRDRDRVRLHGRAAIEYRRALTRIKRALPKAAGAGKATLLSLAKQAGDKLVAGLNAETSYYLKLKAVSKAKKRNAEALKLRPKNTEALTLNALLAGSAKGGSDAAPNNSIASQRIAARRATTNPNARFQGRRGGVR